MRRYLFNNKMREKITLTLSVRALAASIAAFALVVAFALVGGYQGLQANHRATEATKQSQMDGHRQRVEVEGDLQAQIQDVACTLIAIVPIDRSVPGPFREKVLAIIKKYNCVEYNETHRSANPKVIPTPRASVSITPMIGAGRTSGNKESPPTAGADSKVGHPKGSPSHRGPAPAPSTSSSFSTSPPLLPIGPILSPICKLLTPVIGSCFAA